MMFFTVQNNMLDTGTWYWTLHDGTPDNPGEAVCAQFHANYATEAEARSAVSAFRMKAGGVKFAKVVTV